MSTTVEIWIDDLDEFLQRDLLAMRAEKGMPLRWRELRDVVTARERYIRSRNGEDVHAPSPESLLDRPLEVCEGVTLHRPTIAAEIVIDRMAEWDCPAEWLDMAAAYVLAHARDLQALEALSEYPGCAMAVTRWASRLTITVDELQQAVRVLLQGDLGDDDEDDTDPNDDGAEKKKRGGSTSSGG